jgi:hypothetical protein
MFLAVPLNGIPYSPTTCILNVTTVPIIDTGSVMLVTNPLHEPFHDLRPAIASSHCPLLGDAMGIVSADTFISHDFAAAIAVPPANSKIFLPCNIIVLVFLYA